MKKYVSYFLVAMLLTFALSLPSCSTVTRVIGPEGEVTEEQLSPMDQASVTGKELGVYFKFVYREVEDCMLTCSPELALVVKEKIAPKIDAVKPLIAEYIRTVAQLQDGGTLFPPGSLYEQEQAIRRKLNFALHLFYMTKGDDKQ